MDYADLYLQHSHYDVAGRAAGKSPAQGIHELVGGTLSAQACTARLEVLEQRVGSFEEKLVNLTRLMKLTQGLQAEKEADLRRESDELRARLQRQEHMTAQLVRELAAMRDACGGGNVGEAVAALTTETRAAAEAALGATARLDGVQQAQEALTRSIGEELDATKTWARRNLVRLKDHVDALRSELGEMRGGHGELTARLERMDCRAELEYKKLRVLLQQKATEADAMAAILDKELRSVRRVAERHEVLGSEQVSPLAALKFADKTP